MKLPLKNAVPVLLSFGAVLATSTASFAGPAHRHHHHSAHVSSYSHHRRHFHAHHSARIDRHSHHMIHYATAETNRGETLSDAPNTFAGGVGRSDLVSEARRYIGGNPTGKRSLWCGNFMNLVLERTGHGHSNSNTARSFASYGQRISGPQVGAIAVMSRRGGGHVGVVSGVDAKGNVTVVSGNHNHLVAESTYSRARIYAYVLPK